MQAILLLLPSILLVWILSLILLAQGGTGSIAAASSQHLKAAAAAPGPVPPQALQYITNLTLFSPTAPPFTYYVDLVDAKRVRYDQIGVVVIEDITLVGN